MSIDKTAFEHAIAKIDDGKIFESFAIDFLAATLGYEFIPVGGTKDKGVDAFEHVITRTDNPKIIFQLSTELQYESKIENTIKKLGVNEVEYSKLYYVTNRKVNNAESIVDRIYSTTGVHVTIFDIRWFSSHCNESEKVLKVYDVFVDTYLHEYSKPGKYYSIANLSEDSRLFVFLGQQFDKGRSDLQLDNLLADTLIIYSLEGTDPEKKIFKNEDAIKNEIKRYLKFDPRLLDSKLSERLKILSTSPRKIQYHSPFNSYCLPYETRVQIIKRNLEDELLFTRFYEQTQTMISKYFADINIKVKDIDGLIKTVFNRIFSKQGLEFSNFVLHGDSHAVVEQNLNDVISSAVDESAVIVGNKEKIKTALHLAIRDIVYNGSEDQRKFLKSLSNTYLMMFLLQWEPKLSIYFQSLASNLKIFVDNSILVPALSEYYLSEGNRRHWNLLVGANKSGLSMFINESMLNELVAHFKMISSKYTSFFAEQEEYYLNDESELLFIDEVLIRAYFYAKKKGDVIDFNKFIDNFLDPNFRSAKEDLVVYLKDVFGITFISNESWDIRVNPDDKLTLSQKLSSRKTKVVTAESDAEMILAIYYLRNKHNESSSTGIFGYKTWWLSKDTTTYEAVVECFGTERYPVSCYIRPDFIYNYIALKPNSEQVNEAYREIFPTMLGVNLSYHMPREVSAIVQSKIKEFNNKPPVRVKQILKTLSERLKTDPNARNRKTVELFLDEQLKQLQSINSR